MTTQKLHRFLDKNVPASATRENVVETLESLYDIAESGGYDLSPASALKQREVQAALCIAVRAPVTVAYVTPRTLCVAHKDALTWTRLGDLMRDRTAARKLPWQLTSTINEIVGALVADLEEPIWNDVWENVPEAFDGRPWMDTVYGITRTLSEFLAAVATPASTDAQQLAPLIRLFAQALPLGEMTDQPGTWLVLVNN